MGAAGAVAAVEMIAYDPERHHRDIVRIWEECGWIERGNAELASALSTFAAAHRSWVLEADGAAEVAVFLADGVMRCFDSDLPFSAVTAVTAGLVYRQRGGAGRLLARALAQDAAAGKVVAGLGVFDIGFYDRLGFGTGCYEKWYQFDPGDLRVPRLDRAPQRLTIADAEHIHASRCATPARHGDCYLTDPRLTSSEMILEKGGFGLGFREGNEISHHIWFQAEDLEKSTWRVLWYSYRTKRQFIELLSLIASFRDQVRSVYIHEPSWMQIQELVDRPFRAEVIRRGTDQPSLINADAYWQARILDVPRAVAAIPGANDEVQFSLNLSDPIDRHLTADADPWTGCAGQYQVKLGAEPSAKRVSDRSDKSLQTLSCSIGSFTRLWLGVVEPQTLKALGEIDAPEELIDDLARCLPTIRPQRSWDF